MPQQPEAKFLHDLTEVPAGWPLATVIDAFAYLGTTVRHAPGLYSAVFETARGTRALQAVSHRLAELWVSQPAEADFWLQLCRERFAKQLAGK
ncbi:hypothetical protein AK812_SmicGene48624, partial [Symbiodinium microadriaticum]